MLRYKVHKRGSIPVSLEWSQGCWTLLLKSCQTAGKEEAAVPSDSVLLHTLEEVKAECFLPVSEGQHRGFDKNRSKTYTRQQGVKFDSIPKNFYEKGKWCKQAICVVM